MIGQQLQEGDLLARRYLLQERIAAGGMSVIWRAWDESLQRVVAVKVLDGPIGAGRGHHEVIRREAQAAARIDHPSAIQVYDYGETVTPGGRLAAYVVLQLLDGESVAARIDRAGPLPVSEAIAIAVGVADVLSAAHARGVVHRDVTPENVMLTSDGVKLLDFGIAAHVGEFEDGALTFGTPPYVAPERLAGGEATGATDIYALGVLLYEMLTGVTPYPETTWHEIEAVRRDRSPPRLKLPDLPTRAGQLYELCLSSQPGARPTADQVAHELRAVLARDPASRTRRDRHRGARRVFALAVVVGLLLGVIYVSLQYGPSSRAPGISSLARNNVPAVEVGQTPSVAPDVSPPAPAPVASSVAAVPSLPASAPRRESSPAAAPVTVNAAAATVFDLIDRGVAADQIRADVSVDLKQEVSQLTFHRDELTTRLASVRTRIKVRLREKAMTAAVAAQIDAAVVQLGRAIERYLAGANATEATPSAG